MATLTSKAGRPGALRLGTLTIDRTPNRIDGAFALAPDSGAVGVGGTATLSFRVLEPVDDVHLWAASLGDKVPGSVAENPHRAVAHRTLPATLDDDAGLELGPELAGVDGVVGEAAAAPRWRALSFASAAPLSRV